MLVLERKLYQKIFVGPDICITVCELKWGAVKIGIDAPPNVEILREEILMRNANRILQEQMMQGNEDEYEDERDFNH